MQSFFPQPHYYHQRQPDPREQYLRALAGQRAGYGYDDGCSFPQRYVQDYEDLREMRAREYQRQQLAARQAQLERERELQRRRQQYLEARRRQAEEEELLSQWPFMFRRRPAPEPEAEPEREATPIQPRVTPSPKPRPSPEQLDTAARVIQTTFRTHQFQKKALADLNTIRSSFQSLVNSFVFPSNPSFANANSPKLSYDSVNGPIHAHEDALVRLLSKLDAVESNGNNVVRKARKALARDIERELEGIDAKKLAAWESWKAATSADSSKAQDEPTSSSNVDALAIPLPPSPLPNSILDKPNLEASRLEADASAFELADTFLSNLDSSSQQPSAQSEGEDSEMTEVEDMVLVPLVDESESFEML